MKKKILFVINTLGRAGAETALIALLKELPQEKFDIYIYVLMGQGELISDLPPYVKVINKKYCYKSVLSCDGKRRLFVTVLKHCFAHFSILKNAGYLISNLAAIIKNKQIKHFDKLMWKIVSDGALRTKDEFDLAIAYLEGGSTYYVDEHVTAKKKAAFIHIDYEKAGYTRKLDKDCYLKFDRIFTVSDEVKQHFLNIYGECDKNTKVFHNLLDTDRILKLSKQAMDKDGQALFNRSKNCLKIVTVGRLTYQKGYDVAIQALKVLVDKGLDICWFVIGEGPEHKALSTQIKALGLEKRFFLVGAKSNPYPYYKAADLYVHATRFEGKSIAIQEAQILGCCIIASDCSGNREQIENGIDGILCPFSKEGISSAIMKLTDKPLNLKKYGHNAAQRTINHTDELNYIYELL